MTVLALDLGETALEVSTAKETIELPLDELWHISFHVGRGGEEGGYAFRQRAMKDRLPRFTKHT